MSLIVQKVSSWTEVIYMNIFLLVVKDSTRKQTDVTDISSMCWYTYVMF